MFVSHETYTPARGGSAAAEINALRQVFGADADPIVITNTKGFTGHAMGAGIEDVVAIKALETGIVPPVPNFQETDPELGELNLSRGGAYPVRYALRLAAGFGSQIACRCCAGRRCPTARHRQPDSSGYRLPDRRRAVWRRWLRRVSGQDDPRSRSSSAGCGSSTPGRCAMAAATAPGAMRATRPSRAACRPRWRPLLSRQRRRRRRRPLRPAAIAADATRRRAGSSPR